MKKILNLLFACWKLEKPKLVISVTGGAQNFLMKPKLKDVFRKGLVKAAISTNAWISTGGTNAGVMKHVGEAIQKYPLNPNQKIVVLGIANWCTTANNTLLIKKDVILIDFNLQI
jgi:transient receptor potential cation channel subfamily M protein 2